MYDLKDYLNSVNYKKNNLMVEDGDEFWEKKYPTFIVNKCLSVFADTVLFANEMNGFHHMDKKLQYDFYLHGLPKKKRFSPWMKAHKIKNLDLVKEYFGYSNEKARIALTILNEDQLEMMQKALSKGGKK